MIDCKKCGNHECRLCGTAARIASCKSHKPYAPKPITNADRIRAMTDEELADWASAISLEEFGDKKDWLDWLRQEAI